MSYTRTGRRPWIAPLAVVTLVFLAFSLPPYLSLDPARSRLPVPPEYPWYYPMLVTHIAFGTVALVTACLQVWPWLRCRRPDVHRWSGRVYVFGGALPASVAVLAITPLGSQGPNQQAANTMLALLWFATTVAGWRAARRRRFAEHREWMIRSFALAFSIVANRLWGVLCVMVFALDEVPADGMPSSPDFAQAIGVATWMSWVVNLLIAEWWLHRTRHRRPAPRPAPAPEPAVV